MLAGGSRVCCVLGSALRDSVVSVVQFVRLPSLSGLSSRSSHALLDPAVIFAALACRFLSWSPNTGPTKYSFENISHHRFDLTAESCPREGGLFSVDFSGLPW